LSFLNFKLGTEFQVKGRPGKFFTLYQMSERPIFKYRKMYLLNSISENYQNNTNITAGVDFYLNNIIKFKASYSMRTYKNHLYNVYDRNLYYFDRVKEADFKSISLGIDIKKRKLAFGAGFVLNSTNASYAFPLKPRIKGLFNVNIDFTENLAVYTNFSIEKDKEITYFLKNNSKPIKKIIKSENDLNINISYNNFLINDFSVGVSLSNLLESEKYTVNGYFTDIRTYNAIFIYKF
jgi:hypothetical protein